MTTRHTSPLRIIFAGTPDFAAASLQALIDVQEANQYELVAVYTQPDRPAGRGHKLVASPVKQLAMKHNIPVLQPLNFKANQDRQDLADLNADIMIVAAYGLILPKAVLDTPKFGCINVHASLLPRWRGAAPIHRAVIAGDTVTGITIMQMDVGLDTGDMLLKKECPIMPTDTSGSLHDRLALLGGQALLEALEPLRVGQLNGESQDESLTCYADKLTKQEGLVDWSQDALTISRKIRGLLPWPGAYTQTSSGTMKIHAATLLDTDNQDFENGEITMVSQEGLAVSTGKGSILITELQFPGGKRMSVQDALNGKFKEELRVANILGQESTS
ncbi:methionyl-tRNA formyltransferase [Marinomonas piezotolerans]|uniref:Methionyl-tRNA formyltransferase n=1 Tax=Marinomonas piezotolerans TaxID=2213058 RepID=A0A370UB25_9GAMM|nr:methionyl-tRNA formyltransferase [Marinomonas piezotolerans]RDL44941.1 methionyl-tRNA formyltransferase [Marinomonas piezotolerans]